MEHLTENQVQQLVDRYDPDDLVSILEPDIVTLIELLEPLILHNLHKFELDGPELQEVDYDGS